MSDQTLLASITELLDRQQVHGLVHYVDLAAALADLNPERFGPAPGRG